MSARNETLDRSLLHMAWANADVFARLAGLPDASLALAAPGSEWSVAAIAHHIVTAAENYAQRLHGEPRAAKREVPTTAKGIAELGTVLAEGSGARGPVGFRFGRLGLGKEERLHRPLADGVVVGGEAAARGGEDVGEVGQVVVGAQIEEQVEDLAEHLEGPCVGTVDLVDDENFRRLVFGELREDRFGLLIQTLAGVNQKRDDIGVGGAGIGIGNIFAQYVAAGIRNPAALGQRRERRLAGEQRDRLEREDSLQTLHARWTANHPRPALVRTR